MPTFRMWVPNRRGRAPLHFFSPAINANSVVHVSASEATGLGPPLIGGGQNFSTNFGSASITVQNISVREGAVDFNVFVDWPTPLNVMTDITILEPPAQVVIGT
jgi:hypothetical protein